MDRHMLDYLPEIMKRYAEFIEIAVAEQKVKEKLWNDVEHMFKQGFVSLETDIGAKRWEKTLKLTPKDTDSIDIRNFRIRGKLLQDLPYTYRTLKRMLDGICGEKGYDINMDIDNYTIDIRVALISKEYRDEVAILTDDIVPANLIINVTLMYNTHGMIARAGKTHAELALLTHTEIKEHPFE